jgi:hypothetical protein
VCTRGSNRALLGGPSTSPLGIAVGVDASIKPLEGTTLGSAAVVREAFLQFFPGIKFTRCPNTIPDESQLRNFAAKLLPPWIRVELRQGPQAPFFYQGDLKGDGWSMLLEFDDSESVSEVTISFYGSRFDQSEKQFDALFTVYPWELKL